MKQEILNQVKVDDRFESVKETEKGIVFVAKRTQKKYTVNFEAKKGFFLAVGRFTLPFDSLEDILDFASI